MHIFSSILLPPYSNNHVPLNCGITMQSPSAIRNVSCGTFEETGATNEHCGVAES